MHVVSDQVMSKQMTQAAGMAQQTTCWTSKQRVYCRNNKADKPTIFIIIVKVQKEEGCIFIDEVGF